MKRNSKLKAAVWEALEARTLLSGTPPVVMGYLVDYKIANGTTGLNESGSGNGNGAITHDNLDWKDLNQVNYFSLEPDVSPAYVAGSTASQGTTSDGNLQSTTSSGYDPSVQLPAIVKDAKSQNHPVNVFVTIGGGDPGSIYDMDALVNTPSAYAAFAASVKSFCTKYGLTGVDLDWEPTAQAGFTVTKTQLENYGTLIETIKKADPNLTLSADTLGDPVALSDASGKSIGTSAYMLDALAVQYLDAVNVEAYPVSSESEANTIMTNWKAYLSGGADVDGNVVKASLSKLQYGVDVDDDTSNNPANVVEDKVDLTIKDTFGGIFVFEADSDTANSILTRIGNEITKDLGATASGGSVSGSIKTSAGDAVAGVTVYVDANGNVKYDSGELHAVTNSAGAYTITGVPAGAQVVRQVLPSGDTQTSPADNYGIHVTVKSGGSLTNENFTDTVPAAPSKGSVSGFVKTSAGTAVAGVTVYIDANDNTKFDSGELFAVTTSAGAYAIANVPAGAQVIRQVLPSGDTQTSPADNYGIHVTVKAGGALANENFTDTVPATSTNGTISGFVKTSAGAGVSGVMVYVDTNGDTKFTSGEPHAVTNSAGAYTISNVPAGAQVIRQVLPTGDTQTSPADNYGIHVTVKAGATLANENFTDTASAAASAKLSGKIISAAVSANSTLANAFDGNLSTSYHGSSASGNWIGLDFGTAENLTQLKFTAASADPYAMEGGVFQASNTADFSSGVVNLYTVPNTSAPSSTSLTAINLTTSGAYRYVRYLAPADSFGDVAEIQFFGKAAG